MPLTRSYTIRRGIYFAAVDGEGVIMDLVQDRYYGLEDASATIWSALQAGGAPESIVERVSATTPTVDLELVLSQLEAWKVAGLVSDDSGNPLVAMELPEPKAAGVPASIGIGVRQDTRAMPSALMASRLLSSTLWSRWALRRRGIGWTLKRIQTIGTRRPQPEACLDDALQSMLGTYRSCRSVFRKGTDDCLMRSLTLAGALRGMSVDADVCFGVQKFPFLAHAWVEVFNRVANEEPATIQKYTMLARF